MRDSAMARELFSGWGGAHLTFAAVVHYREKPSVSPKSTPKSSYLTGYRPLIFHLLAFSPIKTKRKYKK